MEWTTQSEEQAPGYGNGQDTQPLPPPAGALPPVPTHAAPVAPAAQIPSGFDHCPSCGALVAADQRYCLECGHRRGDPRLPFMDAVVFMDAMKRPPEAAATSTKAKKRSISPNAALIAGVGTLLLALGVGVLIGRSGDQGTSTASQTPIVIHGGGAEEEAKTATAGAGTIGGDNTKGKSKKQVVKQKTAEAESGKGAEEVLKPKAGVKLPPATVKVGEKCQKDVVGCNDGGEFDGSFFGE